MEQTGKYLVLICGPTASGKTSVAIQLAKHYRTDILSTDSRQIFKEMSIGTAKPSEEELKAVPHHFIDSVSISEDYNAGRFEAESISLLDRLFSEKDVVLAAGGTGLYINALLEGLDDIPQTDPSVRAEVIREFNIRGLEHIRKLAKKADPAAYAVTDTSNHQRLMRIIEIYRTTGKPISDFRTNQKKSRPFHTIMIGLEEDREVLYERINERVDKMMDDGLLEEVRGLLPHRDRNALQTVGYSELFEHLDGKIDLARAVELIKRNSRRYAKRQMTWFRNDDRIKWFRAGQITEMIEYIDREMRPEGHKTDTL